MPYFQIKAPNGKTIENFNFVNLPQKIGRSEDSGLFLDDSSVSRNHALISQKNDRYCIEDVDSLNGVWVNGTRLESICELHNRDRVMLGDYELTFVE